MELRAVLAFAVAAAVSGLLTPLTARLAARVGAVDEPRERGLSSQAMPRLGGLAVLAGVLAAGVLFLPAGVETRGILGGGLAIGIAGLFVVSVTLAPFIAAGAFLVVAYNLELFEGRFHTDLWFAVGWGAFPALTGWWSNALGVHDAGQAIAGAGAALGCFWVTIAQRRLSTPVRELRRRTLAVSGEQRLAGGASRELTMESLAAPLDGALRALSVAMPLLAAGLVALRL